MSTRSRYRKPGASLNVVNVITQLKKLRVDRRYLFKRIMRSSVVGVRYDIVFVIRIAGVG